MFTFSLRSAITRMMEPAEQFQFSIDTDPRSDTLFLPAGTNGTFFAETGTSLGGGPAHWSLVSPAGDAASLGSGLLGLPLSGHQIGRSSFWRKTQRTESPASASYSCARNVQTPCGRARYSEYGANWSENSAQVDEFRSAACRSPNKYPLDTGPVRLYALREVHFREIGGRRVTFSTTP